MNAALQAGLDADQRAGVTLDGKPSLTIDQAAAQLDRDGFNWGGDLGQAVTLTYAYRADAPATYPGAFSGFVRTDANEITFTEQSLTAWSDVANVHFVRVGSGTTGDAAYSDSAQILIGEYASSSVNASGVTFHPSVNTAGGQASVWINASEANSFPAVAGGYGAQVITHELGHALGLDHPSNYEATENDITYAADAAYYEDSRQYSVMSYFPASITGAKLSTYPQAPQLDDIAAVQRLYGANYTTRADDTVYGFHSNADRPWYVLADANAHLQVAIWDGGGTDTLDFSLYGQNQLIDLREGAFSDVGGSIDNVAIAVGAKIENALGGSGADVIMGNALNNLLQGEAGADTLFGGDGADTLLGGGGADLLLGNTGDDVLSAGADASGGGASAGDTATLFGGQGDDTLHAGVAGADLIFGNLGDDMILAGGGADTLYGGQGDDLIDGRAALQADYMSGDLGADTLLAGAGSDTVLGGDGDDSLMGGTASGAGTLQLLFGNLGNDRLSYGGAGSAQLYGGQGDDVLSVTSSAQGQIRELFGNLGADTLTASGGADSLYGGQGNDVLSTAGNATGHNLLGGDLGDDRLVASAGGADTLRGGAGADTLVLTGHTHGAGDVVLIGVGESTATAAGDEANLDHIAGFTSGSDHVMLAGHAASTTANVTFFADTAANASELAAFRSAFTYAYGDGTAAQPGHLATEYLAVGETYSGGAAVYVFTADHAAFVLDGANTLVAGDILSGG